jgi:hypothetical protein
VFLRKNTYSERTDPVKLVAAERIERVLGFRGRDSYNCAGKDGPFADSRRLSRSSSVEIILV